MGKMIEKNDIVVITGAASGIGAAFVRYFAQKGAKLALLDLNEVDMLRLVADLKLNERDFLIFPLDITDRNAVEKAFNAIGNRFEKIDVLINNAGISQISLFRDMELNLFKKVMDVNFYGTVYCTKYALPYLQKQGGQIITLSSVAGFSPLYGRTAYSASKHALHGFMNTLRTEEKENNISVLLACPSFVKTNIEKRTFDKHGKPFGKKKGTPGQLMTPEYVVSVIVKAVKKNKQIVYVSKVSKLSRFLSFFFPRLFERKMTEKVRADL